MTGRRRAGPFRSSFVLRAWRLRSGQLCPRLTVEESQTLAKIATDPEELGW